MKAALKKGDNCFFVSPKGLVYATVIHVTAWGQLYTYHLKIENKLGYILCVEKNLVAMSNFLENRP